MIALRAVAMLMLVLAAGAAWGDDDFLFLGPAPTRNFQPIQLIFLNLPFERAATLGHGEIALLLNSAESNEIATTQGPVESTLKFETNRTVFGARYGLAPHWEVGIDLPFITRYGGCLDPVIDEIEGLFGVGNVERDYFHNNSFGAFTVRRADGTKLFEDGKETFALGDLWLSAKREVSLGEKWPLVALRAAVKAPTGSLDKVTGSGEPDFGLGVAADYRPLQRLMLYLNMSLVYPMGPITDGDLTLDPILSQSFAAELALTRHLTALLHQAAYTSPMHGTRVRLLDGSPVEIGLGLNYAWNGRLGFQLLGIDNVSGVEQAADFSLVLSAVYRTRGAVPLVPVSRWPSADTVNGEQ